MEHPQRLPPRIRLLAAGVALVALVPLGLATQLAPDPRGWGTHEQLGWSPCWFRLRSGRPCPTCGMTTAWAYAVRGNALAAVDANLGGALLAVAAGVGAAALLAAAATGRPRAGWLTPRRAAWIGAAWLVAMLADWARRLTSG